MYCACSVPERAMHASTESSEAIGLLCCRVHLCDSSIEGLSLYRGRKSVLYSISAIEAPAPSMNRLCTHYIDDLYHMHHYNYAQAVSHWHCQWLSCCYWGYGVFHKKYSLIWHLNRQYLRVLLWDGMEQSLIVDKIFYYTWQSNIHTHLHFNIILRGLINDFFTWHFHVTNRMNLALTTVMTVKQNFN
jgi:hypothetical protein